MSPAIFWALAFLAVLCMALAIQQGIRLIASAPDLLEALEAFVASFNAFEITNSSSSDLDHIGRLHVIARAAIANARGEA